MRPVDWVTRPTADRVWPTSTMEDSHATAIMTTTREARLVDVHNDVLTLVDHLVDHVL